MMASGGQSTPLSRISIFKLTFPNKKAKEAFEERLSTIKDHLSPDGGPGLNEIEVIEKLFDLAEGGAVLPSSGSTAESSIGEEMTTSDEVPEKSKGVDPTEGESKSEAGASIATSSSSLISQPGLSDTTDDPLSDSVLKLTINNQTRQSGFEEEMPGSVTNVHPTCLTGLEDLKQPKEYKLYKNYPYELSLVLNGTEPFPNLTELEQKVFKLFRTPSSVNGQFTISSSSKTAKNDRKKHFYNYLLLDPKLLEKASNDSNKFCCFVESVFYVGKGKDSRLMDHLKDTEKLFVQQSTGSSKTELKVAKRLLRVLDIWSSRYGVVILQLFRSTTESEALTREGCLIEAIGIENLTNVQGGQFYGEVFDWIPSRKRQLGVHLLYKAFKVYEIDTPPPLYRGDF